MKKNLKDKKIIGAIITLGLFLYYIISWGFLIYAIGSKKWISKFRFKKKRDEYDKDEIYNYDLLKEKGEVNHWLKRARVEEVYLISKDNLKLYGRKILKNNNSHKWVIAVHGYRTSGESMERYAIRYYNRGYNVVIPDLRSHRNSEGKFIGMGWLDKDDIKLWIKYIINIDREAEIVLHGVSM